MKWQKKGMQWLVICLIALAGYAFAESFVVKPTASKKSLSSAALADALESHLKDLIGTLNHIIGDAAYAQDYYLHLACTLLDGERPLSKQELMRLLDEIKAVETRCVAMHASLEKIKKELKDAAIPCASAA